MMEGQCKIRDLFHCKNRRVHSEKGKGSYSQGAINLKNEIVQHILQKRFDLSRS